MAYANGLGAGLEVTDHLDHAITNAADSSDPKARTLSKAALEAYLRANSIYLSRSNHRLPYIPLESARRPVRDQATLFRRYIAASQFNVGSANPANRPGSSNHELGFAIDVALGGDRNAIEASLAEAGWRTTIPKEPWHFEAVEVDGYSKAQQVLKRLHDGLSAQYAGFVVTLFSNCQSKANTVAECMRLRTQHSAAIEKIDRLAGEVEALSESVRGFDAQIATVNSQKQSVLIDLDQTERRLAARRYDLCPNQQSYQELTMI